MPKPRHGRPIEVNGDPAFCLICGYAIPADVVSREDPLLWTVDHSIPKSRMGSNNWRNRTPAHRWCNMYKGAREVLTDKMLHVARCHIAKLLMSRRFSTKQIDVHAARAKLGLPPLLGDIANEDVAVCRHRVNELKHMPVSERTANATLHGMGLLDWTIEELVIASQKPLVLRRPVIHSPQETRPDEGTHPEPATP